MEPSGNWLTTEAEGRRRVNEGYVKFATSTNDYILVFAIRKYLLREGEGFYITDLGKCSMPVCQRMREWSFELCLPSFVPQRHRQSSDRNPYQAVPTYICPR